MPIAQLIAPGLGFSPGSEKFLITRGLGAAVSSGGPSFVDGVLFFHAGARGVSWNSWARGEAWRSGSRGVAWQAWGR